MSQSDSKKRRTERHAWAGLGWALSFFVAGQLALLVLQEKVQPGLREPEYANRLSCLRRRLAAEPGRPLVLVLGSSRTEMGLRPEILQPLQSSDRTSPLVFNFGLSSSGAVEELVLLRRLLAEGIRPDVVLVEVLPCALSTGPHAWEDLGTVERLTWGELGFLKQYCAEPGRLYRRWLDTRIIPCCTYRMAIQNTLAPRLLPEPIRSHNLWNAPDRSGWIELGAVTAEGRRAAFQATHAGLAGWLKNLSLGSLPRRAMHALLRLCRQEGIEAGIFLMPESRVFRSWYSPASSAFLEAYVAHLQAEFGVPLVDARDWVNEERFLDGHHLLADGAAIFTTRFAREAIFPLRKLAVSAHASR